MVVKNKTTITKKKLLPSSKDMKQRHTIATELVSTINH